MSPLLLLTGVTPSRQDSFINAGDCTRSNVGEIRRSRKPVRTDKVARFGHKAIKEKITSGHFGIVVFKSQRQHRGLGHVHASIEFVRVRLRKARIVPVSFRVFTSSIADLLVAGFFMPAFEKQFAGEDSIGFQGSRRRSA